MISQRPHANLLLSPNLRVNVRGIASYAQAIMAAVNSNMFEISLRPDQQNGAGGAHIISLPLNLIAHIVSWVSVLRVSFSD